MRKQLLFTAVVSLFVACSQDAIEEKHETQTSMVNIPEKIYAEIDNVTSRTYVEEGNHLRWNEGDEISYFPGITYNLEYRFDGKTGDNSGSFTKITDKLVTGNELENTYAFSCNASGRKIYVPASDDDSIINAYKSAWSGFKSYIYEYEF